MFSLKLQQYLHEQVKNNSKYCRCEKRTLCLNTLYISFAFLSTYATNVGIVFKGTANGIIRHKSRQNKIGLFNY